MTVLAACATPQRRRVAANHCSASSAPAGCVPRSGAATWAVVVAWLAVVAVGMGCLWQYEHSANEAGRSPDRWPTESQLTLSSGQPTLLFFAHPKCPCTRASIGELEKITVACKDQLKTYAIFFRPADSQDADWEQTDQRRSVERIPGVTVISDIAGTEASRFQAATSGLAILYDQNGDLQFRGGITSSRGHRGENLGRSTIVQWVTHGVADAKHSPVYGCELGTQLTTARQSCCQK